MTSRRPPLRTVLAVALVLGGALPVHAGASRDGRPRDVARFALVIGNNQGPPDLPVLRYADDDAARLARLLEASGATVTLLAVPDAETQRLAPDLVERARPPDMAGLRAALAELFDGMREHKARGESVEFMFAFAGHGRGSPGDGGAIFLLDASLGRAQLHEEVVRQAPADFIHVLIDACDSYFMVAARGGGGAVEGDAAALPGADERVDAANLRGMVDDYLGGDGLSQDIRTGYLVSTNQQAEAHEFSAWRAGIFSHVVRSALSGAADSDGDGRIEYSEVLAYAAAASQEIRDPRARLSIHGRAPPRDVHHPLMDLSHSRFAHWLQLGPAQSGRIHVTDADGQRYADVHKAPGGRTLIALVPGPRYTVSSAEGDAALVLAGLRPGAVRPSAPRAPDTTARGVDAGAALSRELYAVPFDASYLRGFVASRGLPDTRTGPRFEPAGARSANVLPPRPRGIFAAPGMAVLGLGGLLGLGAAGATVATFVLYQRFVEDLDTSGTVDSAAALRINLLRTATGLLVTLGLGALAVGAALVALELVIPLRLGAHEEAP